MTTYRKKPFVIEATQWCRHGDHAAVVAIPADHPIDKNAIDPTMFGWVPTLEGGHAVTPGDWIITGVKGEHYPCKPDIFALTYEPATPPAQPVLAPVVREPLSIEQILSIADEADLARDYNDDGGVQSTRHEDADITEEVVNFARAIERHFGIQTTTGEHSHG